MTWNPDNEVSPGNPPEFDRSETGTGLAALSERERQVLVLIGEGYSTEEIAAKLQRRVETVRSHRRALGRKLGISSRVGLVRFAICSGLCSAGGQVADELVPRPHAAGEWLSSSGLETAGVPLAIVSGRGEFVFATHAFVQAVAPDGSAVVGRSVRDVLGESAEPLLHRASHGERFDATMMLKAKEAIAEATVRVSPLTNTTGSGAGFALSIVSTASGAISGPASATATHSQSSEVPERTEQLESVISLLREEVQSRQRVEARMAAVLAGVAAATGSTFFHLLVRHLAEALRVGYAAVVEVIPGEEGRAKTVAFWNRDRLGHEREFDLAGTLCAMVIEGKPAFYPSGVRTLFGPEHILGTLPVDSYLGVALVDSDGRRIGVLAVMDESPMPDAMEHIAILRAFAARAAGELERRRSEAARKESESRYQVLADLAPIGVFVTDVSLACTYVNKRWKSITGVGDYAIPADVCDRVLHPEDRARVKSAWASSAARHAPFESEHRIVRPDGSVARVHVQARPYFDGEGRFQGYIGTIDDVSEQMLTCARQVDQ